uniref:Uncharacterized protein n=1 Tax=Heterorhabditis bacteriophora TaxID=37862 RepID=A0A1I7XRX1_HETBA
MQSGMGLQYMSLGLLLFMVVSNVLCDDERTVGWNKANGLWGKRSVPQELEIYNQQKRPVENWSKLNTLWGKR